jgi:hypothetical protein
MSLIYGLVARGSTILAEHTNSNGNFASGKKIFLHCFGQSLILWL